MQIQQKTQQRAQRYIGITGLKTIKEVLKAVSLFKNRKVNCNYYYYYCDDNECGCKGLITPHKQMLGFLVSDKRLQDPNSEGTQSPALKHLNDLIDCAVAMAEQRNDICIPMIHYYTQNRDKLAEEISKVFTPLYERCKAVQINIAWPDISQIEKIKQEFPELHIVLQLNKEAMDKAKGEELIQRAKEYEKLIEYILIDSSGGKGVEFDVEKCAEIVYALTINFTNKNIGIAGGFDGDNVEQRVWAIYKKLQTAETIREPLFCIDAQGKLRTPDKEAIDTAKMEKYIRKAMLAFRKAQHDYDEEYFDRR